MATITTDDGIQLYYEEVGEGVPMLFVHEFAGDLRSFEPQMRHFARRYRCIAFNARGYPPSEVPEAVSAYSQARARDDILAVLDGLSIQGAHVVGLSMGSLATLHFGLHYPDRALSLVLGGCGYGAEHSRREQFRMEAAEFAVRIEAQGMQKLAGEYGSGPTRVQFENKDPRGFAEFVEMLAEHSSLGSANTLRGVQMERPSLYDLQESLAELRVPTLIMAGDEDEPCLAASLYLKRTIPSAGLTLLPNTGHALNLEEPDLFHRLLDDFLHQVDAGRWRLRDPRSLSDSILTQDD
ncbi:MAG: alpha/beta hydrolase [Gammaproteobacteria bacterium]|nr:MAG: alpha/beta hydrolase [Gammaproteobacteria bacterium]